MSKSEEDAAYTLAAYLRIASIAVALYDYLETLPKVFRFHREHIKSRRFTSSFVLLVALRISSITVLVISSFGFFYSRFTIELCRKFFLLPPSFKVVQAMVSQAILGVRAWNLARRARYATYLLCSLYFISCVLQWITTLYQRDAQLGTVEVNCRAYNRALQLGAYIYYAIAVIYDFATTAISVVCLLKYKLTSSSSMMSKVIEMMLYDGIGYFVALAAVNVLNLILYRKAQDIQTAAASLAYCISWIMSQRLLLHLYDASRERRDQSAVEGFTVTRHLDSAKEVNRAVRSQFDRKSRETFDLTVPDFDLITDPEHGRLPEQLEVQVEVRVEHTVKLDRQLRTFELENYSRSEAYIQELRSRQNF